MKRALLLTAVQVGVLLAWAGQNEHVRATAPVFRVPLQPVDPFDLLRGRYFSVNPQDRTMRTGQPDTALTAQEVERFLGKEKTHDGPTLVGFCPEGELMRVCGLRRLGEDMTGPARFWSRARVHVHWMDASCDERQGGIGMGWQVSVDLGLDRFFIPNRAVLPARENEAGWELEVFHRPGLAPLPRRLFFRGHPVNFR